MHWDDLRYFLAIARSGTLAGAARSLSVNHSTMFRRINGFEDDLGVRLFDRLDGRYALTITGEEMRASAERMEHEIERLDRRIAGRDLRLQGSLVVTTTDTLASCLLGPHLAAFKRIYPGIDLELVLDNQHVNLSKRQADVAVRPTLDPPETLVGRRLCDIAFSLYATESVIDIQESTGETAWVTVDESLAHLAADKWFREFHPESQIAMKCNSLLGVQIAASAGIGAAIIPCFMGDPDQNLVRLRPPVPEAKSMLWLLTHEDLRHTARVRAFMDYMADALSTDIPLLEGMAPPCS